MNYYQASMVALAQKIGGLDSTDSTSSLSRYYVESIENLAKMESPPIVYSSGLTISTGSTTTAATHSYPTGAVDILGVFSDTRQLYKCSIPELEAYDSAWRSTAGGTPLAFAKYEEEYNEIRIIPFPSTTTTGAWIYAPTHFVSTDNLCTESSFETTVGWSTNNGWDISTANKEATCDGSQTPFSGYLYYDFPSSQATCSGHWYQLTYRLKSISAGAFTVGVQGGNHSSVTTGTATGTQTGFIMPTNVSGADQIQFSASSLFVGAVTNVQLYKVFDIPSWLAWYVAFDMLSREYARLSAHQDKEFASISKQFRDIIGMLIGL